MNDFPNTFPSGSTCTAEAFEAIARTLRLGNDRAVVDRLGAMRRPDESYSEVILRLVEMEGSCAP